MKNKPKAKVRFEPFGRPTKYDPKYCQMLIDHMASGLSFESFSAIIDTSIATLYNWERDHGDFLEAKRVAYGKNLVFWERAGREGMWDNTEYDEETGKPKSKRTLNSTVWIFNMKNRHKWRDKQEEEAKKEQAATLPLNMTLEMIKALAKGATLNDDK